MPHSATSTDEPALEVYADTRRHASCQSCNATIEWLISIVTGEPVPFNARQFCVLSRRREQDTRRVIARVPTRVNHWNTCPGKALF
jgi:hypothetical protein